MVRSLMAWDWVLLGETVTGALLSNIPQDYWDLTGGHNSLCDFSSASWQLSGIIKTNKM